MALARAVYRDADIYLLDDPMSAMDALVGAHIFNQCIKGVLANKTRILVTHHLYLLSQCDLVVILDQGEFKACGSYHELANSGINLEAYLPDLKSSSSGGSGLFSSSSSSSSSSADKTQDSIDTKKKTDADTRKKDDRSSQISTLEEKKEGDVKMTSYIYYIMNGGPVLFLGVCLFMGAGKGIEVWSTFYLSGKYLFIYLFIYLFNYFSHTK